MTKQEARRLLDDTKVYVGHKSREIQEKLFTIGYEWVNVGDTVDHLEAPFLYIEKSGYIERDSSVTSFEYNTQYREITADDILNIKL